MQVAIVTVFLLGFISSISAASWISERAVRAADEQYKFGYTVDNNIQGNFIAHYEKKVGDTVEGYYTYDDKNVLRTVFYIADKNGFRVLEDQRQPSKKTGNLDGIVNVSGFVGDETYKYSFKEAPRVQRGVVRPRG